LFTRTSTSTFIFRIKTWNIISNKIEIFALYGIKSKSPDIIGINEEISILQELRYLGFYLYKQPSEKNLFFISNKTQQLFNSDTRTLIRSISFNENFDRYILCKNFNNEQFFRINNGDLSYDRHFNQKFCKYPTNEELDFAEKHSELYEFEKKNLKKTRDISIKCCDIVSVQKYINNVRINLMNLLKTLYKDDYIIQKYNEYTSKTEECILKYLQNKNILDTRVESFNLRENINIIQESVTKIFPIIFMYIINIKLNNIDVCTLNLNLDFNNNALNKIIENMKDLLGLKQENDELLKSFIDTEKCGYPDQREDNKNIINNCLPTSQSLFRLSLTSISNTFKPLPIYENYRKKRINNKRLYKIEKDEIYPKLSKEEEEVIKLKICNNDFANVKNNSTSEINYKSTYGKLLEKYNIYGIAGPSNTAGMIYTICKQFTNFNFDLFLLACIGFFCFGPYHTIFEILIMFPDELKLAKYGNPYKLMYDGKPVDEYELIEKIIEKINCL
jgi:hypothetical protein